MMINALKSLIPILVILISTIYGYQQYLQSPSSAIDSLVYLPIVLAAFVGMLTIHFNRSSIFFFMLLIMLVSTVLIFELTPTMLHFGLLSAFAPLLLLFFTIMPERGLLSVRSIPVYAVLLLVFSFSLWTISETPELVQYYLLTDWLPARYFDWTYLPQTVIFCSLIIFFQLLLLNFLRPSPLVASSLGVLVIMLMALQLEKNGYVLNVFISAGLLMCLYAVVQESWRMAYLDELTALPGRRALRERFQSISGTYTVAMLDVDHFKKFNDTYGHDTGDEVLRMIASKMKDISGKGLCYRYGGEEFAIVFPGKKREDSQAHLETLRTIIADMPFVVNRQSRRNNKLKVANKKAKTVQVTVSIGVADSKKDKNTSAWSILKQADTALYRAKKKGRNRVSA